MRRNGRPRREHLAAEVAIARIGVPGGLYGLLDRWDGAGMVLPDQAAELARLTDVTVTGATLRNWLRRYRATTDPGRDARATEVRLPADAPAAMFERGGLGGFH
ncbi:MAG: hypothetical protein NT029_08130 [Armatimonadetes bacterium]|nr:hypothetical protein [Armatimonadota bacterium]